MNNKKINIYGLVIILFMGNLLSGTNVKSQISSDADIIAIVTAINQNELNVNELAQTKMTNSLALDYANMMVYSHKENITTANNLIASLESGKSETPDLATLKQKGSDKMTHLDSLTGREFESAYLDAMVTGHTDFLNMIDLNLIPMVKSDAVKMYLMNTRETVARHLIEANKFIK